MTRKRPRDDAESRLARGRQGEEALFPAAPVRAGLPRDYADTLGVIKQRIQEERLRVVLTANTAMSLLYWDIGRMILERQERAGWGAKVVDRLAADGYGLVGGVGQYENLWRMAYVRGPEGIIVALAERIG